MSLSLFIPKIIRIWRKMTGTDNVLKGIIGLFYFLILSSGSFSQSCPTQVKNPWQWPSHSNWFIGPGLKGKFSAGGLTISSIPNITNYEGTSGASDDWGNLLFLNNGRLLWDAQGNLKYSGLLEGNEGGSTGTKGSASQGVITVRHPLDTTNYYIFTVDDALTGTPNGLSYSIVDRKGNFKAGPVRLGNYRTTEGITATKHANGVDLWVTVCGASSTNFYTYLITCSGVVKTPVISAVAVSKTGDQERGGLAFSWDSKYFVQAHPDSYPNSDKEVTVYKFDNKTGIISDPHHISSPSTGDNPYDVTFSTDNSKIYFSTNLGTISYYDISSWNTATMAASIKSVPGVSMGSHAAIEIGGDGNLYIANPGGGTLGKLSGNLNTGSLTFSTVPGAITSRGLPTMYLPPYEEPDIDEVGPFCTTDGPVNLNTHWICSGLDAEDPVAYPDSYSGKGITDKGNGIFDPKVAGDGTHMIIFKRCSVDDTIFITVKPCSCPDTTIKDMPPLCAYDSLDLKKYVITAEPGIWSLISGPSGSAANIKGTFFYANNGTPGKYTVRYTINKQISGCPDSAERIIIINPVPVVNVTSGMIKCNGESTICSASGANTYTWSNGDFGASISITPLVTASYTVTGTDANGCMDTASILLVVPPKLNLKATVTNVNCLANDNGTASIAVTGGTPGYLYYWSNGQQQSMITGLPPGSYTVVVTDANKCMDSTSVLVGAPVFPTADFDFSTGCFGTPVEFKDRSDGGSGTITSYKWDFGEPSNAANVNYTNSPAPYLYNSVGTFDVKLVVITDGGCADSVHKPVDISPIPKVNFGSPFSGCKPVCAYFSDSSTVVNGTIVKWTWNFGDPSSGSNTSGTKSPEHCYNTPGFYHVTLTVESDKGCKASLQKKNLIEVLSSPTAAFTSDVHEAEIFNPTIRFFDQSSGSPVSWHWDFGDKSITTDTSVILNPRWTYTDTGKYNVCLTVKNKIGCSDFSCHPIVIKPYWTFYIPNAFTPNGDGVNDFFNGTGYNITEYQLWIYDRWGNMIYTTGKADNPETSKSWDGRANNGQETAQEDVYVWKVHLRDIFKKGHTYVGTVTIVK